MKSLEIAHLEENLNFNLIGDKLKYHRILQNLSQLQLANAIGLKHNTLIKNIENNYSYPTRNISSNLANYFKLDAKYFYDPYLEETDQIHIILLQYRKNNNLTIKDVAKLINVSSKTLENWEKQKYDITRENYYKLKEMKIL